LIGQLEFDGRHGKAPLPLLHLGNTLLLGRGSGKEESIKGDL
jgi:hypothetical protein